MNLRKRADWAQKVLAGNIGATARLFARQTLSAVQASRFEEAGRCRHCLRVLKALGNQARAAVVPNRNVDFVGIFRRDSLTSLNIIQFRRGEISDRFQIVIQSRRPASEFVLSTLRRICSPDSPPHQIVVPRLFQNDILLTVPGVAAGGQRIHLAVPRANSDRAWIEIVNKNSRSLLEDWTGRHAAPKRHGAKSRVKSAPVRPDTSDHRLQKAANLCSCPLGAGSQSWTSPDVTVLEERHITYSPIQLQLRSMGTAKEMRGRN